ncbi:DNA helicase loader [Dickeya phage vB-DsoM-LIMEstone1]|uniref:Loader of gp41 DNA helicase gp59 n=9 Tax=Aglimvirinae TaxID=2169530 RepID=I0J2Q2_9CAUD|nr:DNA helicase loader [Dickeya phage vB-DsoM-LIMEstone1]YP_009103034.1 DNA helicase loader [Dickeya phage RC-2014]ASD51411.1 putative loader of DNA helicase [Dickeya phage XF4]ATW62032.1 loader of DNA helicase [Dickeya phage PP35]AYN55406.1 loader of DNA helicase [Dickeya phage Coodle]QHB41531.1 DNA helicase loader [Dickeya phage Ds5CZ]QHB41935.1 DNA helicase loader [Dickeya phage Ds16CZ]QHB42138.1 DNA helicase loader [Dickeya phage Ds20CZ]
MLTEWQKMEFERAFNVYCVFMAIKLHFTTKDFDYSLYGPMNYKFETFLAKEAVCKQFARLARRFETSQGEVVENYIIANFIKSPKVWVTTLLTKQAQSNYDEYRKLYENFTYNFLEEFEREMIPAIKERNMTFIEYVKGTGVGHPALLTDIITKHYPMWFLVGLNKIVGFIHLYDTVLKDDIYWNSEAFLLRKTNAVVPDEDTTYSKGRLRELIQAHGI